MQTSTSITATGPAAFGVIAERFRRAGQPDKAVALCREGLEKFPDHLSARVTLGWSLLDIGEHQEAFDQLKSVLKRAPDNLAAIRGLAELHERGIGLSFDALPDVDSDIDLDPVMPAMFAGELDPVMPAMALAMAEDVDPVAPAAELAPEWDMDGDLDPFVEAQTPLFAATPDAPAFAVAANAPQVESAPETPLFVAAVVAAPFEIEDVIDAGESDAMFDLSGLLALDQLDQTAHIDAAEPVAVVMPEVLAATPVVTMSNVIAMPEPVLPRKIAAVVEGAPLALRDGVDLASAGELIEWLSRVRERRTESVSQYMAG